MTSFDTTAKPVTATLSEKELFKRFLAAPMRFYMTASTLARDPGELITPKEWFQTCMPSEGVADSYFFAKKLLEEIEDADLPENAMEKMVLTLEEAARMLRHLNLDYSGLKFYGLEDTMSVVGQEEAA